MSNRFKAVGLFCRALWGEFSLPCRPILQFFSENFNFFLLFSECFQFSCSQFPVGLRGFFVFSGSFQFVFKFSILYLFTIRRISTMSIIIGIDHGYYDRWSSRWYTQDAEGGHYLKLWQRRVVRRHHTYQKGFFCALITNNSITGRLEKRPPRFDVSRICLYENRQSANHNQFSPCG